MVRESEENLGIISTYYTFISSTYYEYNSLLDSPFCLLLIRAYYCFLDLVVFYVGYFACYVPPPLTLVLRRNLEKGKLNLILERELESNFRLGGGKYLRSLTRGRGAFSGPLLKVDNF
jgi:hypothetical protein